MHVGRHLAPSGGAVCKGLNSVVFNFHPEWSIAVIHGMHKERLSPHLPNEKKKKKKPVDIIEIES